MLQQCSSFSTAQSSILSSFRSICCSPSSTSLTVPIFPFSSKSTQPPIKTIDCCSNLSYCSSINTELTFRILETSINLTTILSVLSCVFLMPSEQNTKFLCHLSSLLISPVFTYQISDNFIKPLVDLNLFPIFFFIVSV